MAEQAPNDASSAGHSISRWGHGFVAFLAFCLLVFSSIGASSSRPITLRVADEGRTVRLPSGIKDAALLTVIPTEAPDRPLILNVSVLSPGWAYCAGGAALLFVFALLISLSRLQLLLWFVPTVFMTAALTVPLLSLTQVWWDGGAFSALLSASGVTYALGAVTSPKPTATYLGTKAAQTSKSTEAKTQ